MTDNRGRRTLGFVLAALVALPLSAPAPMSATSSAGTESRQLEQTRGIYTAGIPLVTKVAQPRFTSEAAAQEISDAEAFAEQHPADVAYPWIDPASETLVLSAASPAGRNLLGGRLSTFTKGTDIRDVEFSLAKLEAITDEIVELKAAGGQDVDLIYGLSHDFETNRLVIRVSAPSDQLFRDLADRFGTSAIALLIDPASSGGAAASRLHDRTPYFGGAAILNQGCTDSFSWWSGSGYGILTAAHCVSTGGNVTIDGISAGNVTATSEENWSVTYGTRYYTGQSIYRGDVGLIRLTSPKISSHTIYRGGTWQDPDSSSTSVVTDYVRRNSLAGEEVYVGGQVTGETGRYEIIDVKATWWYTQVSPSCTSGNCVVRHISRASKMGPPYYCAYYGDSGGSVFNNDGGPVVAYGTLSGLYGTVRTLPEGGCGIVFTDIYDSYVGLPGNPLL